MAPAAPAPKSASLGQNGYQQVGYSYTDYYNAYNAYNYGAYAAPSFQAPSYWYGY